MATRDLWGPNSPVRTARTERESALGRDGTEEDARTWASWGPARAHLFRRPEPRPILGFPADNGWGRSAALRPSASSGFESRRSPAGGKPEPPGARDKGGATRPVLGRIFTTRWPCVGGAASPWAPGDPPKGPKKRVGGARKAGAPGPGRAARARDGDASPKPAHPHGPSRNSQAAHLSVLKSPHPLSVFPGLGGVWLRECPRSPFPQP